MPIDQRVTTGNEWEQRYGYSRAVRTGDLVFVTGTVPMNGDGTPFVPDDGVAQATRCLEIILQSVTELGGRLEDLVRSRFYVTDMARADEFGRAHRVFFGGHGPCLSMVQVAGLIDPRFLLEIEAEAVIRSR